MINQPGTAQTLFWWKLESFPLCCQCSKHIEIADHVICCESSANTWALKLCELDLWLTNQFTDPTLHGLILDGLHHWFHGSISSWTGHSLPGSKLPSVFASQQILGWRLFLCGYIFQDIIDIQAEYYSNLGSRKSPSRWATNLINILWRLLADIWIERNQQVDELIATNDKYKASLLNLAIKDELLCSTDGLPSFYNPFFRLTPDAIVSKSISSTGDNGIVWSRKFRLHLILISRISFLSAPDSNAGLESRQSPPIQVLNLFLPGSLDPFFFFFFFRSQISSSHFQAMRLNIGTYAILNWAIVLDISFDLSWL